MFESFNVPGMYLAVQAVLARPDVREWLEEQLAVLAVAAGGAAAAAAGGSGSGSAAAAWSGQPSLAACVGAGGQGREGWVECVRSVVSATDTPAAVAEGATGFAVLR